MDGQARGEAGDERREAEGARRDGGADVPVPEDGRRIADLLHPEADDGAAQARHGLTGVAGIDEVVATGEEGQQQGGWEGAARRGHWQS